MPSLLNNCCHIYSEAFAAVRETNSEAQWQQEKHTMNLRNASFIKANTEESKHKDMSGTEQKKKGGKISLCIVPAKLTLSWSSVKSLADL